MSEQQIAVLIDGGFFLKRISRLLAESDRDSPEKIANALRRLCFNHIVRLKGLEKGLKGANSSKLWQQHLYRIFFYDAMPFDGKAHHPISNKPIDFAKSKLAQERLALFEQLRKVRKLALRLGKVNREHDWTLSPNRTKEILKTRHALAPLQSITNHGQAFQLNLDADEAKQLLAISNFWQSLGDDAVRLGLRQKGVDMRVAIDIASLALKQQVGTIVLVAGDSDFVPAAKLARREGLQFILDPLWQSINADLFEHIDGLQSGIKQANHENNVDE
ncbi:MAG: NYN domain-containing protein [Methylophilaceae bacterium]|nr:NYN domain-containing protein [Methylophilaceae bacterium]